MLRIIEEKGLDLRLKVDKKPGVAQVQLQNVVQELNVYYTALSLTPGYAGVFAEWKREYIKYLHTVRGPMVKLGCALCGDEASFASDRHSSAFCRTCIYERK